jgi:hypothetical protein
VASPVVFLPRKANGLDTFNIFNHTNFGQPNGNFGSRSFARITGVARGTNSRLVQLGAKFIF